MSSLTGQIHSWLSWPKRLIEAVSHSFKLAWSRRYRTRNTTRVWKSCHLSKGLWMRNSTEEPNVNRPSGNDVPTAMDNLESRLTRKALTLLALNNTTLETLIDVINSLLRLGQPLDWFVTVNTTSPARIISWRITCKRHCSYYPSLVFAENLEEIEPEWSRTVEVIKSEFPAEGETVKDYNHYGQFQA